MYTVHDWSALSVSLLVCYYYYYYYYYSKPKLSCFRLFIA